MTPDRGRPPADADRPRNPAYAVECPTCGRPARQQCRGSRGPHLSRVAVSAVPLDVPPGLP